MLHPLTPAVMRNGRTRSAGLLGLGAVLGLCAGIAAERKLISGRQNRLNPGVAGTGPSPAGIRRAGHLLPEMYTVGAAGHGIYVRQFAPDGIRPENLMSHTVAQETPGALISRLAPGLRPLPVHTIAGKINARRNLIGKTPGAWNAETVALRQIEVSRVGPFELPVLNLGFARSDYATFQVLASAWEEHSGGSGRALGTKELHDVLPGLSNSFGINLTIETADGQLLLTTRSGKTANAGNLRHISVNEGMSTADADPATGAPDPYRTAMRGIEEELGAHLGEELRSRITFHSLICDVTRYEWALLGHVNLAGTEWTSEAFMDARKLGMAADSWETSGLEFIPMTPDAVQKVLCDDSDWVGHGYMNLLLSSVHRFKSHRAVLLKTARTTLEKQTPVRVPKAA